MATEQADREDSLGSPKVEVADFHIVGIGASAGGLDSLEKLFTHLPTDTGMAFVVLQHLSPDFKSVMDELLSRRTSLQIRQAEHDMPVEPNTVYLLPPVKEMIIRQRRLLLNDRDPRHGLTLPIDLFFRSLAHDVGDRAVAVILSGSGSDGSRGVQEISKSGGTVLCESPDTAQFNGMPLSAMRTGTVDHVLPPEEIALAIAALVRASDAPNAEPDRREDERGVDAILRLLRDEFAIDFSHYKTGTVTRRIERRLALNRSLDIDMYVEQLRGDARELSSLYEDLLIGVTRFFRDDLAFEALEHRIIPELVERTEAEDQLRVWVPGCATGQEAYSIAMLVQERLQLRKRPTRVKILATDVHKASLEIASTGLYTEEQVAGVGEERLRRFFTRKAHGYQVAQTLRDCIIFAPHNVIRDAPFTKMDLIACRNLLIYFQPHAQKTVLTLFHFCLKPGGFLFLGSSESPAGMQDEFDAIDEHARIYRKRRDLGLPRDLKLPIPRAASLPRASAAAFAPRTPPGVSGQLLAVYDRLLDRFMPPSFLVDHDGQLVDMYGGVDSLLKIKPRRPTQNLLDMLSDEVRSVVSGALHRVRRDLESVRYPAVQLPGDGRRFSLVAEPLRDAHGALTHVLISLADDDGSEPPMLVPPFVDIPSSRLEVASPTLSGLSVEQHRALEEELAFTKEHLQTAIQEHETANEELQATNEELVAANEELQSTNEELHSVNEEMYTVNAEYQKKNHELQELNNDIEHLLNGTEVATIFLDRQLNIRKFTPRIAETFRVIPQDVGRPIHTFAHDLTHPTLIADIERVLADGVTIETQTWDKRQRCYFLRILPYRGRARESSEASFGVPVERQLSPEGVVLTLTDISALEHARAKLAQLSAIVESSDDAIIGKTLDGVITSWNAAATRLYGYSAAEAIGRHATFFYPTGRKDEIDAVVQQVRLGRAVDRKETERQRKNGSLVDVLATFSPIIDSTNAIVGVSEISRDITQLVGARREIADREERIRLLLDSTAEAIYGIDLTGACIFCNSSCARLLGYESPASLIGKQLHLMIHGTGADCQPYPPERSPILDAMRRREGTHVDDELIRRADGGTFPSEYWSHPIFRGTDVIGAVVTFLDVTDRRRAEQELQEGVRRREQFLAMLSHELRNPLAAILSATRVLEAATWGGDDSCNEAGRVVARQANHMSRLLDDLLDVARITRGHIALRTELVDLRSTARSAIEALGPFLAEHNTQLKVEIADDPIYVVGDAARLQQVQANLLSNASKYSPQGSTVDFELTRVDGKAMIRVTDRGRGIEPDMLPRIFDLFVQGHQSLARSDGGLGIGLTLLKSLVELHHGSVDVSSDGAGKGSVFTVWLPVAPQAAVDSAAGSGVRAPVHSVVIVEDQDDARLMLQLLLEAEGMRVYPAANGLDGVELIERQRPDLAIVDLGLPVVSGFELARRIRQDRKNDNIRLVALSGYGQDTDIQASLAAGFDEHLTKPPDPDRLDRLLKG